MPSPSASCRRLRWESSDTRRCSRRFAQERFLGHWLRRALLALCRICLASRPRLLSLRLRTTSSPPVVVRSWPRTTCCRMCLLAKHRRRSLGNRGALRGQLLRRLFRWRLRPHWRRWLHYPGRRGAGLRLRKHCPGNLRLGPGVARLHRWRPSWRCRARWRGDGMLRVICDLRRSCLGVGRPRATKSRWLRLGRSQPGRCLKGLAKKDLRPRLRPLLGLAPAPLGLGRRSRSRRAWLCVGPRRGHRRRPLGTQPRRLARAAAVALRRARQASLLCGARNLAQARGRGRCRGTPLPKRGCVRWAERSSELEAAESRTGKSLWVRRSARLPPTPDKSVASGAMPDLVLVLKNTQLRANHAHAPVQGRNHTR